MNYLILGINGDIGKSIFENLYNEKDNFILTYGNKRPNLKKKNIFLYKLNFKLVEKNIIKINELLKKFKDIDVVINNVGDSNPFKSLLKIKPKELENSLKINFYSAYFVILQILKNRLKKNKPLNIINLSSNTIKYLGSDKNLPYLVSKNALEIALLNLSKIYSWKKIKINIIRPGVIKTKKSTKINNYTKNIFLKRVTKIPVGQAGNPRDISNYVKYLIDDKSKFIFGQVITIAGGE
tara:strand:- start:1072 stop:1785 length:714 start_codon:yes stop_codon:yes gene_type:complete